MNNNEFYAITEYKWETETVRPVICCKKQGCFKTETELNYKDLSNKNESKTVAILKYSNNVEIWCKVVLICCLLAIGWLYERLVVYAA